MKRIYGKREEMKVTPPMTSKLVCKDKLRKSMVLGMLTLYTTSHNLTQSNRVYSG